MGSAHDGLDDFMFQSSTSRHGGTDNNLILAIAVILASFNPLHRGMGVLTISITGINKWQCLFQSSTSRHGGTDLTAALTTAEPAPSFNPLHRGMGVLTRRSPNHRRGGGVVSILYIEAWGY